LKVRLKQQNKKALRINRLPVTGKYRLQADTRKKGVAAPGY
jgi:hypothetical protein